MLQGEGPGGHPHPLQVAFWAIGAGWVFLLGYLAARRRLRHLAAVSWRGWVVLALMGFFGWAGYAGSLNVALVRLAVPEAIIINYLHPVFTVIFQGALFGAVIGPLSGWEDAGEARRRPTAVWLGAGMAVCLLGVAVIATRGRLGLFGHMPSAVGAAAALFAAFAWGVYSNLGRFVAARPGRELRVGADVQTLAAMTLGLVMLAVVLAARGMLITPSGWEARLLPLGHGPVTASAWLIAGLMGLVLYCIGFTAWLMALDTGRQAGGAHMLPPLTYITPVLGIALARILLSEPLGSGFWQGAVLIAGGNAVIALGSGRGRRALGA
jgi:drug/metabolite transporter (DMT)-like permease